MQPLVAASGTLMSDNGSHEHCGLAATGHRAAPQPRPRRGPADEAVQLRTEGWTYEAIAQRLGYTSRATVFAIVRKALDTHEAEEVARLRSLETARLDRLQASLWGRAMTGDVAAAAQARQIIETRIRLLGCCWTGCLKTMGAAARSSAHVRLPSGIDQQSLLRQE